MSIHTQVSAVCAPRSTRCCSWVSAHRIRPRARAAACCARTAARTAHTAARRPNTLIKEFGDPRHLSMDKGLKVLGEWAKADRVSVDALSKRLVLSSATRCAVQSKCSCFRCCSMPTHSVTLQPATTQQQGHHIPLRGTYYYTVTFSYLAGHGEGELEGRRGIANHERVGELHGS